MPQASPLAYLTGQVERATHGPKLYWIDEANGKKTHIAVDVIPSLEHTQSSTVTQFPVQDGTVYSDHIIHFPDQLKLEIVQTNTPFEDTDPKTGDVIEFDAVDVSAELPKTNFRPRGLLLLSLALDGLASSALGAIGISVGGESSSSITVDLRKNPNFRDRINELNESLRTVRLRGQRLSLQWLGTFWTGLAIESISYKRTVGSQKGSLSVTLTQVDVTTTDTVALPSPVDLRLKPETTGGNKPATKPSDAEEKAIEEESGAHKIFF